MTRGSDVLLAEYRRRRSLDQLATARGDIQEALQIASYAREHITDVRDPLWLPLQDALVVTYARPFSSNRPVGPLASEWGRFDDSRHQELHNEIIVTRNQLVASTR